MFLLNKRWLLRIITVFITVVFATCNVLMVSGATNKPSLEGEVVSAQPNDTVNVKIFLSNNPGIVSATINVTFDTSVLSLTKVTDGGFLGVQSHKPEYTSPYTLAWVNDTATKNFTSNGAIAILSFKVSNSASYGKTYPIRISYDYENYDIYDKDLNTIRLQTINGAVKISHNRSFILGDANNDSKITIADTSFMQKYIAQIKSNDSIDIVATDVDEDGYTTIIDVTYIQRYLSKISVPYPIGTKIV